jgi:competence protein ComEC
MDKNAKQFLKLIIIPLLAIFLLLVFADLNNAPRQTGLTVSFFDVGQGDSAFITTFRGKQILIDGGPGSKVLAELGSSMPFWDRSIDVLMLSHPHTDHVAGLIEVLRRYRVRQIIMPEVEFEGDAYNEFVRLAAEKNIRIEYAYEGQRIFFDDSTVFDVYHPDKGKMVTDNDSKDVVGVRNPNEASIVGRLVFGQSKILFTGDIGADNERILAEQYDLDSDILKVAHQGSRFSTSDELVKDVTPEFAVIMVGQNSYGHPTKEVLDRLNAAGVKVFRTDKDGMVRFFSNGDRIAPLNIECNGFVGFIRCLLRS